MKIGDIVIVHILPRAIDQGIIVDVATFPDKIWYKVKYAGHVHYLSESEFEPVNCSLGIQFSHLAWTSGAVKYNYQ